MEKNHNIKILDTKLLELASFVDSNLVEFNKEFEGLGNVGENIKNLIVDYKSIYMLTLEINWLISFLKQLENESDNINILKQVNSMIYEKEYLHKKKVNKLYSSVKDFEYYSLSVEKIEVIKSVLCKYFSTNQFDLYIINDFNDFNGYFAYYKDNVLSKIEHLDINFRGKLIV